MQPNRQTAKPAPSSHRYFQGSNCIILDAELRNVTRNKRSISALKERDVKNNREDQIKIEIIDSVRKSNSNDTIPKEKNPDAVVDSIKNDENSRKDSSSQLDLKASTSSDKLQSGSEEKKKEGSNRPTSSVASNSSEITLEIAAPNTLVSSATEDKGAANSTTSVGSDLPITTSSLEKLKEKSKRKKSIKNVEGTDKVLADNQKAGGSKSTPVSPTPEKKHKKRSISSSSKKDKDKEKGRSKTPDRERLGDDKSKLTAIPEAQPLANKDEAKSLRKSEGHVPNRVEKTITLVNGEAGRDSKDATKSQNEGTGVLSNNSNSRTASVGTSTGVGKKKRSTSITLTEEEMSKFFFKEISTMSLLESFPDQIFIKANPKDYYSISHKIGKG